jgi:nitrile hydratase subunit beta
VNGAHDMGGMDGFGSVEPEPNEPMFHAEWERRAFALTLAMARPGGWNLDMTRSARENRAPQNYLSKSYYEIWLAGLERLMAERGLITPDEVEAGRALTPRTAAPVLAAGQVEPTLIRGGPSARPTMCPARYAVGNRVRAKDMHPKTHTRLPRYVRGHIGTVELVHGCHVFPDTNALGHGEQPQWLYTVSFDGRQLWGADGDPTTRISVDSWESYLEPVQ